MPERSHIGIPLGTPVLSLEGALPVEFLYPGDRIVTRRGSAVIKAISPIKADQSENWVAIRRSALGGQPEQDITLPGDQRVFAKDGFKNAAGACLVKASCLVGHDGIRWVPAPRKTLYAIFMGRPEIIYAGDLQLLSADEADATAPSGHPDLPT